MNYVIERIDVDSSITKAYKGNLYTMIASSLCINIEDIEIGVQKQNTISQEECNNFRFTEDFLDSFSLTEGNGITVTKKFYKRVSNNDYMIYVI